MKIKLNGELKDIKGNEVSKDCEYAVIRKEGSKTILKKAGKGKQKEIEVKTWELAKVCDSITSPRGGKRIAREGKKVGRPKAKNDKKIRSVRVTEREFIVVKQVIEDLRNLDDIDSTTRYKRYIRGLIANYDKQQQIHLF